MEFNLTYCQIVVILKEKKKNFDSVINDQTPRGITIGAGYTGYIPTKTKKHIQFVTLSHLKDFAALTRRAITIILASTIIGNSILI